MSSYREDCNHAKAVKAGIIEQRPVTGKNGKVRPVVVEYRIITGHALENICGEGSAWRKWKAYRNEAEAQFALGKLSGKPPSMYEYRLREKILAHKK